MTSVEAGGEATGVNIGVLEGLRWKFLPRLCDLCRGWWGVCILVNGSGIYGLALVICGCETGGCKEMSSILADG